MLSSVAWGEDSFSSKTYFQHQLDSVRTKYLVPGMAAAIVKDGKLKSAVVSGVRKVGDSSPVRMLDAFQIGSVTKPITAMLAYILDRKKILPVTTRITDVFPELRSSMQPAYRVVTVKMLLTHLAAFPYQPNAEGDDEFLSLTSDLRSRRYEYVKAAVIDAPVGEVGKFYQYSGGTIIVAAMMERVTGKSWETLVQQYIFAPLNMRSAGYGAMSATDQVTGIWEHQWLGGKRVPIMPPAGYSTEPHAPAGRNIHVSIRDLAKFMIAQFPYNGTARTVLTRQALLEMQTQTFYSSTSPGWFIDNNNWSNWKTVYHNGDNGKSIATFVFSPKYEAGYIVLANISGDKAWNAVSALSGKIETYLATVLPTASGIPDLQIAERSLTRGKTITASNVYYDMDCYSADKLLDGNYETRWGTDYGVHDSWFEVDLGSPQLISTILLKEEFAPRVTSLTVLAKRSDTDSYATISKKKGIGDELVIYPTPFTARYVRIKLKTPGVAGPTLSEFHLFRNKVRTIR